MKKFKVLVILLLAGYLGLEAQQPQQVAKNNKVAATKQVDRVKSALSEAKIDPANYEFSGQITASVYIDGRNFESEDFCLYTVVSGRTRGVSRGLWFEPGKEWIHNHLTYSNSSEGDTIRFRLMDTRSGSWYEFDEYVVFKSDMLVANAISPFKLQSAHLLEPSALSLESALTVWPNPASYQASIRYIITTDQPVVIQVIDLKGRIVDELEQGRQKAGEHSINWSTSNLEQGVYHLRMKNDQAISQQVVITR